MKGSIELLGRGLLVLALSGYVIGCGDDGGGGSAGEGGSGGGGGGSGGGGGGSGGGGGGTGGMEPSGGGDVTVAECVDMTDMATGGMLMTDCPMCICTEGLTESVACAGDAMCWALITCVRTNCAGLTGADRTTCATTMCMASIGGAGTATPLGMILTGACVDECVGMVTPPGDAGPDAN